MCALVAIFLMFFCVEISLLIFSIELSFAMKIFFICHNPLIFFPFLKKYCILPHCQECFQKRKLPCLACPLNPLFLIHCLMHTTLPQQKTKTQLEWNQKLISPICRSYLDIQKLVYKSF